MIHFNTVSQKKQNYDCLLLNISCNRHIQFYFHPFPYLILDSCFIFHLLLFPLPHLLLFPFAAPHSGFTRSWCTGTMERSRQLVCSQMEGILLQQITWASFMVSEFNRLCTCTESCGYKGLCLVQCSAAEDFKFNHLWTMHTTFSFCTGPCGWYGLAITWRSS